MIAFRAKQEQISYSSFSQMLADLFQTDLKITQIDSVRYMLIWTRRYKHFGWNIIFGKEEGKTFFWKALPVNQKCILFLPLAFILLPSEQFII